MQPEGQINQWREQFLSFPVAPMKYPGATRILGETSDKSFLVEWRKRVGDQEADRITNESIVIGESLDSIVRHHFLDPDFVKTDYEGQPGYDLYRSLRPWLNRVKPISLQCELWSERMGVRGFPDIIGTIDNGPLVVIDIKNARSTRRREWITDYFLQCTMYAMMVHDTLGISIRDIAIFMGDRSRISSPQIFMEKTHEYVRPVLERIAQYRRSNHCAENYPGLAR